MSASGLSPAVSAKESILLLYRRLDREQQKVFMALVKTMAAQNNERGKDKER